MLCEVFEWLLGVKALISSLHLYGLENWVSIASIGSFFVSLATFFIAFVALFTWRKEMRFADRSGLLNLMFQEVRSSHFDFISLVALHAKYRKLTGDVDEDPLAHMRKNPDFNDEVLLLALEEKTRERIQLEWQATCEKFLAANELYSLKLISLQAFMIPVQQYPLRKKLKEEIEQAVQALFDLSYDFFECFEHSDKPSESETNKKFNGVNAKYISLLVALDKSKVRFLGQ